MLKPLNRNGEYVSNAPLGLNDTRRSEAICAYRCHCEKREQHSNPEPYARLWIGYAVSLERRLFQNAVYPPSITKQSAVW